MLYDLGVSPSFQALNRTFDEERLKRAAERLFGRHPEVVSVYLYGSAARGEPAHDLDIAVLFRDQPPPPRALERFAADLQRKGAPQGPEIDLRCLNGASPRFRANVLREGHLLFDGDPAARVRAEAGFVSEWLDFKPVWERMRKAMLERLSHG